MYSNYFLGGTQSITVWLINLNVCFRLNLISEVPQPVYKSSYREADIVLAVQKMYVCTQAECIHESTLFYTMDSGKVIIPFKQCPPLGCSLDTVRAHTVSDTLRTFYSSLMSLKCLQRLHISTRKSLFGMCAHVINKMHLSTQSLFFLEIVNYCLQKCTVDVYTQK